MSGSPESSMYGDRALTREEYYARNGGNNVPVQHPDILDGSDQPVNLSSTENPVGATALLSILDDDSKEGWMKAAKCRGTDPSAFFPSDGPGVDRAQGVCMDCGVRGDCLEYALEYRIEHGVWGGASERERRKLLRIRRQTS